jgi:ionotropic glutamate receptor
VTGKRLRIAVPVKPFSNPFVNVNKDETTGKFEVTGYCIDIFEAVMQEMPYAVPFVYVPVDISGNMSSPYSEICKQVSVKVSRAICILKCALMFRQAPDLI